MRPSFGMVSIAEFESFLERCRFVLHEHEKTAEQIRTLPAHMKQEIQAKFDESYASAAKSEKLAREALNRERAKLN